MLRRGATRRFSTSDSSAAAAASPLSAQQCEAARELSSVLKHRRKPNGKAGSMEGIVFLYLKSMRFIAVIHF